MLNQNSARGVFLVAVALFFGLGALRYPIGNLARTGPGLFPLLVSGLLLVLGIAALVRSRLVGAVPLHISVAKIALIMLGLCGFVLISQHVSMLLAIVFLVFIVSYAGTAPSWKRNIAISAVLAVIAYGFQQFLGLNLKLI
jgi:hypothetical protein